MPHPIEASTLRILKPTGETVGTGFLVSKNLAVTCAHVVKILGAGAGDTIDIRFTGKSTSTTALVLSEYWRPDDSTDIAILQVDEVPADIFPLRMGRASESRLKNDLYTFGYAIAADEQGIGGLGTFITLKQEGNFIQFRMHEANHGHSGAPIYDDKRGVVVGMIKKGHTGPGRNAETTFAIPTETIWQVCPQLRPPTPALPRRNPIVEGINLLPYDYDQRIQNFLTEYLGTDTHPIPFGGRDEALHMLDNWLTETPPHLLLAAPAGRGKSALLVRWLDSLKEREDLALAFVPVSIRFGTNMERVFYAALAARLAFLHGDDIPASPETSTAVYRGLVSDYLSKPLANGRTLLVVLDGLDEAADWQAGAEFMPGELPAGVRVLVSARFLAGDADSTPWLRRLNWERNEQASAPSLVPLDLTGVADVLLKMGCPLDELSRKVDIVAELYRLSKGDPLLVGLYVGDLWEKGEAVTRLKPEDLADIQPGYKGYFDRWWDDQKKLWGKDKPWLEKHVRIVRNLLAGALGPLFRDDFNALDPELESDYIADALEILQRFIIGDNQSQGYTFGHPKLGQYFWENLTPMEQTRLEGYFLAWGEQTLQEFIAGKSDPKKKAEVPVYVVRNYSAHLARTEQPIEKWLPLIHHQQWAQAWFTVEGAYGGYSQDVQRVWEQCQILSQLFAENKSNVYFLGEQIRCALIKASLHSFAHNIPSYLIELLVKDNIWTWNQALVSIRLTPNSQHQVYKITELLPGLQNEQIADVLQIVRAIKDDGPRALGLSVLERYLPNIIGEGLATARAITDEKVRACVLSTLSQSLPEVADEALEAAQKIVNKYDKSSTLSYIAKRLPVGKLELLLEWAELTYDEKSRADILQTLAERLPDQQLFPVLKAVQTIVEERLRIRILDILVERCLSEDGQIMLAEMVQTLSSQKIRNSLLNTIAEHQAKTTNNDSVYPKEALTIENERFQSSAWSALRQGLPDTTYGALETAQTIKDESACAVFLSVLIQYLPEAMGEALKAVQNIEYERQRAEALSNLAMYSPDIYLAQLHEAALKMDDEISRNKVLHTLAQRIPNLVSDYSISSDETANDNPDRQIVKDLMQSESNEVLVWSLETSLPELAVCTRSELFTHLTDLMPLIIHLGTDDTPREIYEAVRDVTTWWP